MKGYSKDETMPELWIVVTNWDRWQQAPRNAPWIKNYGRLLHDPNYLRLTGNRRALLHALWLEYNLSGRSLLLDLHLIRTWSRLEVKMADLEALNHAGFIHFSAHKPLTSRARSRDLDLEVDERLKTDVRKTSSYVARDPVENSTTEKAFDFDQVRTLLKEMP